MRGGNIPHSLVGLVNGQLTQQMEYTLAVLTTLMVHTPVHMAPPLVEAMCNRCLVTRLLSTLVLTVHPLWLPKFLG